jgi:hypothetical protein
MWIITAYSFILLVVLIGAVVWYVRYANKKEKDKEDDVTRYL